jgi:AcrR family transcriptional regulator
VVVRRKLSEVRRRQILQAAVTVIGQRGLCDTRISDIAESAGASSALVLYYFGSKDRLLAEALAFSEESFYTKAAQELEGLDTATEQLVRLIEHSCLPGLVSRRAWHDEWLLWLDMWARSPRDPDVARDREVLDRQWRDMIAGIVRTGQAQGEFADIDPDDFALRLAVTLDGLAVQVILEDPAVSPERMFEICARMAANDLAFAWPDRKGPRAKSGRRRPARRARPAGRSTARAAGRQT